MWFFISRYFTYRLNPRQLLIDVEKGSHQLKLFWGLVVLASLFIDYRPPLAQAQSPEPSVTLEPCQADQGIANVKFSPNGQYLVANWPPHSVRIWNGNTGALVATLTDSLITEQERIALSPNNKYVITGGNGGTVMLWDIGTGRKIRSFPDSNKTPATREPWLGIQNLVFSPDLTACQIQMRRQAQNRSSGRSELPRVSCLANQRRANWKRL